MSKNFIIHGQFKDEIDYKKLIESQANTPAPFEQTKGGEAKRLALKPNKKIRGRNNEHKH